MERPAMKLPDHWKFFIWPRALLAASVLERRASASLAELSRAACGRISGRSAPMRRPASLPNGSRRFGRAGRDREKGGAVGNIAIHAVAHAAPDGYTISLGHRGCNQSVPLFFTHL